MIEFELIYLIIFNLIPLANIMRSVILYTRINKFDEHQVQKLEEKLNDIGIRTNQTIRSAEELRLRLKPTSMWFYFNLLINARAVRVFLESIGNDQKAGI